MEKQFTARCEDEAKKSYLNQTKTSFCALIQEIERESLGDEGQRVCGEGER